MILFTSAPVINSAAAGVGCLPLVLLPGSSPVQWETLAHSGTASSLLLTKPVGVQMQYVTKNHLPHC
ncbi:unnamed protein product [Caretta caretta]